MKSNPFPSAETHTRATRNDVQDLPCEARRWGKIQPAGTISREGMRNQAISRAKVAMGKQDGDIARHFVPSFKVSHTGREHSTKRRIDDYRLSRTAFLMVTINADPTNVVVSIGQAYIAVRAARHQASPSPSDFDGLPDDLGGWSKRFGAVKELDYHSLLGKIPSEE
jgi:hypothetical protein